MKRHVSGIILMVMAFAAFLFGGFACFLGHIQGSLGFFGWQFFLFFLTIAGYSRDDQLNNVVILDRERARTSNALKLLG